MIGEGLSAGDGGQPEVDLLRDRIVETVAEREAKVAIASCCKALVAVAQYHALPIGELVALVERSASAAELLS